MEWTAQPLHPGQCHYLLKPRARYGAEPPATNLHAQGDLLQFRRCNRWICEWCARDDGPPVFCRVCPEDQKQGDRLAGMSTVDATRGNQGAGKGRSPLAGKGVITMEGAQKLHRRADEQSRKAGCRTFVTAQGMQDAKGQGRSMHEEVRDVAGCQ